MYHLRLLEKHAIKGNPLPSQDHLRQLAKGHFIGDPLADDFIAEMKSLPKGQGMKMLDTALSQGISAVDNPPPSLVTLFNDLERQPAWLDFELLELGARAYQRHARIGISALNNVGLMGGYYASAVIKPLMYTGRLDYKADKRVSETTKFTVDVSLPGNMQRFQPGFRAAVKVRMMHAMARAMVSKDDNWDEQQWGTPINQPGMLGTNLLFSYSYIQTCKAHGCRFTAQEEEGILLLWRYVGFLMGVEEHSLPATMNQAARASYAIGSVQAGPDEDSRALAEALHIVPLERANSPWQKIKAHLEMRINAGTTRLFMGKDIANALGLSGQICQWHILLLAPAKYLAETIRIILPGATRLSQWRGQRARIRYVQRITQGQENPYTSVKQLKNRAIH